MEIDLRIGDWRSIEADTLIFFATEEALATELAQLDNFFGNRLSRAMSDDSYKATFGSFFQFRTDGKIASNKIIIIGLGKSENLTHNTLREALAVLGRTLRAGSKKHVAVEFSSLQAPNCTVQMRAQLLIEGILLGSYSFRTYKSKSPEKNASVTILTHEQDADAVEQGVTSGTRAAQGTIYARDLINLSPSVTTPTYLAEMAKKLSKKGKVSVEILEKKEIEKLGMNSYLAVNRGSDEPPKFIKLTYHADPKHKVVIAGKGITFDTGGLSLKDAKGMETMKMDMAGAAAVLGVFSVLPQLDIKPTVVGLIAATENMPGPNAIKPGDVVKAMNGKYIEILNTDAEGRLTLADVLSYAVEKEKAQSVVDLATLTGACMIALGEDVAGIFGNNENLIHQIKSAAKEAGESVWQLPLEEKYKKLLKSQIADLRNIGTTRYGGAITAALFLEEFVDKTPWVHLDIAGPAFAEKDSALAAYGGVGFGVRTILNWLASL